MLLIYCFESVINCEWNYFMKSKSLPLYSINEKCLIFTNSTTILDKFSSIYRLFFRGIKDEERALGET